MTNFLLIIIVIVLVALAGFRRIAGCVLKGILIVIALMLMLMLLNNWESLGV